MAQIKYLDFDLFIEGSEVGYRARVLNSPAGRAAVDFTLPFAELELENFVLRVGRTRRGLRRLESSEMEAAKAFGGRLFETVFDGEVEDCFRSSLDEASEHGAGLRIRILLTGVPELTDLPWEYLYNPALNRFLCLSVETPLVRYLDLRERIRPLDVKPPLRILVMISSPQDCAWLNVEREWTKLREATRDLERRGQVSVERLEMATLPTLVRQLRRGEYHVLHFIGHGTFDRQNQEGILLLEGEQGQGHRVTGQELGMLLCDHHSLRLAILNACEGARTSSSDPFAGTAQSLVQQGIPAVIAMQFEITDEAAITLAHEFYAAVADGYPVDAALAEARKVIFAEGNDVEWGIPVLYMRAPNGRIFDIASGTIPTPPKIVPSKEPLPTAVPPLPPGEAVSPFIAGPPITQPCHFFGRGRELRRLFGLWKRLPLQNAAVIGPRRSGKTSLLLYLKSITTSSTDQLRLDQRTDWLPDPDRHRWIYVDFQDPRLGSREGLLRQLLTHLGLPVPEPCDLEGFMDIVSADLRTPTVILLDEVGAALQRCPELDDTFWEGLRSLASNLVEGNLAFVLAAHESPVQLARVSGHSSPFFNIFGYTATLGPLTEPEARELIAGSPIAFAADDIDWILAQSRCWPILVQILCRECLFALQEGDAGKAWREAAQRQIAPFHHLLDVEP